MLTEFQKQKLPRLFAVHDLDGNGLIDHADFDEYARRIASTRGWGRESPEYKDLQSSFGTFWMGLEQSARARGATYVDGKEWLAYWDRIFSTPGLFEQMIRPIGHTVFTMLDADGDGAVTAHEYALIYDNGGLDPADAAPAFARLDLNHDGRLTIEEMMTLLDQFFRSEDPAAPGNALFGILPSLHAVV